MNDSLLNTGPARMRSESEYNSVPKGHGSASSESVRRSVKEICVNSRSIQWSMCHSVKCLWQTSGFLPERDLPRTRPREFLEQKFKKWIRIFLCLTLPH